ncbi:serine/threonine-protein kinase [Streptomyces sp. H27-S2]|uniref:serine/threonine-protein kinase n=1 Tax=Streptomyces antarcticus TaxID=2996458 RepID=UPI00226FE5A1|nr:serine/threonine-protein kinase [Streptomyces sp. H27-S2]MCY0949958.1 protein kinase [Streptomyces sp. H27-S2]
MTARSVPEHGALPPHDVLLGGRYRLQRPIGSGGTADVFCGVDEVLGREVAVKVFRSGTDTVTADRFCDEARTLARMSHRALVTVYDAGRHGHGAYMVTELIRGVTLRARMDAGPLSPVQVARIGSDISSALDHVHAHGVIHHDVKPSNILLGEEGAPHLADFGLSRTVHDHSHGAPDTLVGTLAYMAPEQFLGQGASAASDIYAMGVTLLEALTGHREFQGTPVEIGTAHLLRQPQIPEGLPDDLARLLKAMTEQAPQARPDAAAVHERLQDIAQPPRPRIAGGAPPAGASTRQAPPSPLAAHAGRTPAPLRSRATVRRHAVGLSLAAAIVAGSCAWAVGGLTAGENTPPTAPSRDEPSAPRNTEAAGPAGSQPAVRVPPLPAASESTPQPSQAAPTITRELQASAGPTGSYSSPPPPAKAPGVAKTKENPGKAKGKDKGR